VKTEAMRKLPAHKNRQAGTVAALQDLDPDHRGTLIGR